MGLISTIELDGHPIAHRDEVPHSASGAETIAALGNWMVALGGVRLACAVANYAMAALEIWRLPTSSAGRWNGFFAANQPIILLCSAWPLALGLILRRTRWPELLKAGALTFLILSVGGVLSMIADWGDRGVQSIDVGSFHIVRQALHDLSLPVILMGVLGATQLVLEFATAGRAAFLAYRTHDTLATDSDRQAMARRVGFGRFGLLISMGVLVLVVRVPAWSAFVEMLSQSRTIREFLLRDDLRRIHSTRRFQPPSADVMRTRELESLLLEASQSWSAEHYTQARDEFRRILAMAETLPEASLPPTSRNTLARLYNGWAWLLATCPETSMRNPQEAVTYARRAIDLAPNDRDIWNTLGVAYFRMGDWEQSRSALYRSIELADEGDAFDWFFLAMIHSQFGHEERAHDWYDKAVEWSHQRRPGNGELYRFQVEAAQMLGLPKPDRIPTPLPPPLNLNRSPMPPTPPRGMMRRTRGPKFIQGTPSEN